MVHIARGNSKLGEIPNISLTPGLSCAPGIPCVRDCYAQKAYRMYTHVRTAWDENFILARNYPRVFITGIQHFLKVRQPRVFRWHVAGDILDQQYLNLMYDLARRHPRTKFLAFTKRHELDFSNKPKNMVIFKSMWPGFGHVDDNMPRAWMQDGSETRIPRGARVCHGRCDQCFACWSRTAHDVVLVKH